MTYCLRLPWPPSANHHWGQRGHRKYITKRGSEFRREVIEDVRAQVGVPLPKVGRCRVLLELVPPDRILRDCDNYIKPVLDALVSSGLLPDDNAAAIKEVRAAWTDLVDSPGCCDVTITELD